MKREKHLFFWTEEQGPQSAKRATLKSTPKNADTSQCCTTCRSAHGMALGRRRAVQRHGTLCSLRGALTWPTGLAPEIGDAHGPRQAVTHSTRPNRTGQSAERTLTASDPAPPLAGGGSRLPAAATRAAAPVSLPPRSPGYKYPHSVALAAPPSLPTASPSPATRLRSAQVTTRLISHSPVNS